jgi:hypothetical protein
MKLDVVARRYLIICYERKTRATVGEMGLLGRGGLMEENLVYLQFKI